MPRLKKAQLLAIVVTLLFLVTTSVYANPVHKEIFTEVSADNIYNHIAGLAATDDARVTGFAGEHKAADYIVQQFQSYGLEVQRQEFPVLAFLSKGAQVTMLEPNSKTFSSRTFTFTPATPAGGLTANVVYAGLGTAEDFAALDVKGKIALIKRGSLTFYAKTQNAAQAGAVGAIIFNNSDGMINGTLGQPTDIPAVALSKVDGEFLTGLLNGNQQVKVTIIANAEMQHSYSQNIIATRKADRGQGQVQNIVVGAHYDGVDSPAANDNASGTATMLEVARVLSSKKLAYDVKFIAFGAEEVGLIGSGEYVASLNNSELSNTAAMINMDMVGVGKTMGVNTVSAEVPSFVADLAETYMNNFGFEHRRGTSSSSDHAPFEAAGIPVVFLNYGPDPYYHTDGDSLDKISKANLYNMGSLVTALTYDLAKTPMPASNNGLRAKVNKYQFNNNEIAVQ